MKTKNMLITLFLAATLALPALAKSTTKELATPLIALMPALKEIRPELKLNAEQNKVVDEWLAEAPAKRKELQQKTLSIRSELREALLTRDSRQKRDNLKLKLNEANDQLIVMSSLCARMLHDTLNKEQYTTVVAKYKEMAGK